jgi:oligopeptide transport system substrate-binding protein
VYTLVPNPYYYGPKPHIQIELPQYPPNLKQSTEDYKLYLAGKLDTANLPSVFLSRWRNKSKEYHAYPSSIVHYLTPNVHLAPFDNVHCRLAVAYAVDRATLAANIERGTSRASYTVVPKGLLGFYDGKDNPHYSVSTVRAELAQCPGRTIPIELKYVSGGLVGQAVGNMLTAAGMNVSSAPLSANDWSTVVAHPLDQTKTQIVTGGWQEDFPDPQDYCTNLLRSGTPYNVGGWHDAAYDRLVDRAESVLNSRTRAQLYIQAQHIALSQGAMISLTNDLAPVLIKPYVHGLIGTETETWLQPKNGDWANVSISLRYFTGGAPATPRPRRHLTAPRGRVTA